MIVLVILFAVILGAVGLGALIYHFAHKTAIGAAAQAAVGSAIVAKVGSILGTGTPPTQP